MNGEFRLDAVFPGYDFTLLFESGKKSFRPVFKKVKRPMIEKHGGTLDLGDMTVDRADNGPE